MNPPVDPTSTSRKGLTMSDQRTETQPATAPAGRPHGLATTSPSTSSAVAADLRAATAGRWGHVKDEVRAFAEREPLPGELLDMTEHRAWVDAMLPKVRDLGHARSALRPELGGSNDLGASVTSFEMMGHGDLSLMVKTGVHWGLCGGAVAALGLPRHDEVLRQIAELELPGCFAMTESGHGSDVQALETTATYDPDSDELVIHSPTATSRKDYIGGAAQTARIAAVFAQLSVGGEEHGVHCILVPIRNDDGAARPGITLSDCGAKGGLQGVDNGRILFDQVRVPRTNLLGRFGDIDQDGQYTSSIESRNRRFFTMLGTLVRGRVSVGAAGGAAIRTALAIAGRHALSRRQFDNPGTGEEVRLIDYRAHQRKLMPAVATAYALMFLQNQVTAQLHDIQMAEEVDESAQRSLETLAAGVKSYTTTRAAEIIQTCREACGGAGYLWANRLTQLRADSDVFSTFEGDNTVLLQLVGKTLLTGFRQAFQAMDTRETVEWAAGMVADTVVEATSTRGLLQRLRDARPRGPELTSRAEQMRLLIERETRMLETLGMRMRRASRPGEDSFAVFNDVQDHLLATAQAHVERQVLEALTEGVDALEPGPARELLNQLGDLYALSTIEEHRAWYLERGRMTGERAKQVVAEVNRLCAETSRSLPELIDGFGIPEAWLQTELSTNGAAYSASDS